MLDHEIRTAVLALHKRGYGTKRIARTLKISRHAVKRVIAGGQAAVPVLQREEQLQVHESLIRELYVACKGNLVRVREKLQEKELPVAYSTLTYYCRRHGLGEKEKVAVGRYPFEPGQEMQHDTSPHEVAIGGKLRKVQCAMVVLCFSRMRYAQVYPTFNRYYCKLFLTEAIVYFGGSAGVCMIDNTHVVVSSGSGAKAVMSPEMVSFGKRLGFEFVAHEKGEANRSAHVERGFDHLERNFYPGREFADLTDLNTQLTAWCGKVNEMSRRELQARPVDLFQTEALKLKPLPLYIPETYATHLRLVDKEGYINLHSNRYSVPARFIGQESSVHEGKAKVRIYVGHELVATHERQEEGAKERRTLDEHREAGRGSSRRPKATPLHEEGILVAASETFKAYIPALKQGSKTRGTQAIRSLYRLYIDYPLEPLEKALKVALTYGLFDLARLERMVLKNIAGSYFRLPCEGRIEDIPEQEEKDDER